MPLRFFFYGGYSVAKSKGNKTAVKKTPAERSFATGDRVQVLSGDYGNARGTVRAVVGKRVSVGLDAHAHTATGNTFDADNLRLS